jgi:MOSC domain-containing protein YiiM
MAAILRSAGSGARPRLPVREPGRCRGRVRRCAPRGEARTIDTMPVESTPLPPVSPAPLRVTHVCVARAQPLVCSGREELSGIRKRAVDGPVAVGPLGLAGDEQADLSVHGGLTKAVYAYPSLHHAFWRTVRAQAGVAAADADVPPGLFGENLVIEGLDEAQLWIGDALRFPDCELAVSEPRFPCHKFNAVMGFNHAAKMMVQSGWCGAYLGVVRGGTIAAGQAFELVPGPRAVGIRELFRARTKGKRF